MDYTANKNHVMTNSSSLGSTAKNSNGIPNSSSLGYTAKQNSIQMNEK
jgi:hypothetical protein